MEFNPRINEDQLKLTERKIILGSFPIWSHTLSEPYNQIEDIEKKNERIKRGDIEFFFGSSKNKFWKWYQSFVDPNVQINDISNIRESLAKNHIGVTDLIIKCKRKGRSSLDKHLTQRTYNHTFFRYPEKKETVRVLCTSKGLMNDMLLNRTFFKNHPNAKIDFLQSERFQKNVLSRIDKTEHSMVKIPFYNKLFFETGGVLECFAIPSPGSPYRKLLDFGLVGENNEFLDKFLSIAFEWFKEGHVEV